MVVIIHTLHIWWCHRKNSHPHSSVCSLPEKRKVITHKKESMNTFYSAHYVMPDWREKLLTGRPPNEMRRLGSPGVAGNSLCVSRVSLLSSSYFFCWELGFPVAQTVKCLPAMRETQVRTLGREDPLGKEMATHSSILAWKIPWTEDPGRLKSMGSQRVGHDWATSLTDSLPNWVCSQERT